MYEKGVVDTKEELFKFIRKQVKEPKD
jgi:hypothetical protein